MKWSERIIIDNKILKRERDSSSMPIVNVFWLRYQSQRESLSLTTMSFCVYFCSRSTRANVRDKNNPRLDWNFMKSSEEGENVCLSVLTFRSPPDVIEKDFPLTQREVQQSFLEHFTPSSLSTNKKALNFLDSQRRLTERLSCCHTKRKVPTEPFHSTANESSSWSYNPLSFRKLVLPYLACWKRATSHSSVNYCFSRYLRQFPRLRREEESWESSTWE